MKNKSVSGSYYRNKTKKWFEELGYDVASLESSRAIPKGDRYIYTKNDIFGADLMAKDSQKIIFIQCKQGRANESTGIKQLLEQRWPACVTLLLVRWEIRAKQPTIIRLQGDY